MCFLAVDIDFLHERESDTVVEAAELRDLRVGTGLLVGELVARETENHETLVFVLLVQRLQPVVLRGETAFGSGVDNHEDLAAVLRHFHLFALVVLGLEIINGSHCFIVLSDIFC